MLKLGAALGWIFSHYSPKNSAIISRNLELCFPEMSISERNKLALQCWQSHAIAALETSMGWWGKEKKLRSLLQVKGLSHLEAALATGRGVMLITGHFTCLELQGVMLALLTTYSTTAKHVKNLIADYELNKARQRHLKTTLFPEDIKKVHKLLQNGEVISFLLDQDYGKKGSVFAPFFNIPTATTKAISRIAQSTHSIVIPMFFHRLENAKGYIFEFMPPFDNYPSQDAVADATRFNQLLEKEVRKYPEQYGWTYKRFATRPEDEAKLYK